MKEIEIEIKNNAIIFTEKELTKTAKELYLDLKNMISLGAINDRS